MHRVHVAVRVYRISEVYRQPAPVRHRSLTLSQPVRGHRRSRTAASRWSKSVASTACANMFASIDRCEQIPKVRQTACAVSPSLSYTLAGGARQPAHSRRRLSMVENLSHRPPAPSCVQAHRYDRIPKVGRRPARRAVALRHSSLLPNVSCHGHTAPTRGLCDQLMLGSAPHEISRLSNSEGRVRPCVKSCSSGSAQGLIWSQRAQSFRGTHLEK